MTATEKRMRRITHQYIMKGYESKTNHTLVGYQYLCNWAVEANWKKTNIANKRISCKNCKHIINRFNKEHPNRDITQIKLIEGYL